MNTDDTDNTDTSNSTHQYYQYHLPAGKAGPHVSVDRYPTFYVE